VGFNLAGSAWFRVSVCCVATVAAAAGCAPATEAAPRAPNVAVAVTGASDPAERGSSVQPLPAPSTVTVLPPPSAVLVPPDLPAPSAKPHSAAPFGRSTPWLGIEMRRTNTGVEVANVFPGSAAQSSGLKSGDRLLALGNSQIREPVDVHSALQGRQVGEDVDAQVMRAGTSLRLSLRLGAKPDTSELLRSVFVGKPAPSISSLRTVSGTVVPSLTQLQGKVVVLEFWATWCVACRAMAPTLNHWYETLSAQGARVLAVSSEPYEEVSNNLQQLGMRYPVFVDESTEVSQAYRAGALPTLFLIDQAGIVRSVEVGFSPERLRAFESELKALLAKPLE
jgi:thiol-disulfide isomerase/thioredoxin